MLSLLSARISSISSNRGYAPPYAHTGWQPKWAPTCVTLLLMGNWRCGQLYLFISANATPGTTLIVYNLMMPCWGFYWAWTLDKLVINDFLGKKVWRTKYESERKINQKLINQLISLQEKHENTTETEEGTFLMVFRRSILCCQQHGQLAWVRQRQFASLRVLTHIKHC